MVVAHNNLEAPPAPVDAAPPGVVNGAAAYTDANAYRTATAAPATNTADAHLSNLSVVDDKSCEKQPTTFWGKVEQAILNAGTIMSYGMSGMAMPEDLLPKDCPAEKVPAPATAATPGDSHAVVPPAAHPETSAAPGAKPPGEVSAAPGTLQMDLHSHPPNEPTINLGDLNAVRPAPNTQSTDGGLQVRLGDVQLPPYTPGADAHPSAMSNVPTPGADSHPSGKGSVPALQGDNQSSDMHQPPAHLAEAVPLSGAPHSPNSDGHVAVIKPQGDTHAGVTPDAHNSKTPPQSLDDVIHKNLGQKPQDLEPGINPRLGCVRILSHALHEADPTFPETNNTAAFRRALKAHGYEEVTVKPGDPALAATHAGDVLIGSRPDGMPSHAAISMGDGTVFNNNSDAGKAQMDSINQFDQGMHDKHGHWMKDGFSDVTIFRKVAPAPAASVTQAGEATTTTSRPATTSSTISAA